MSAPDGFDPKASMLPDPGAAAAPIHTMRGGAKPGESKSGNNAGSDGSLNSENRAHFDDDVNPEQTQKILADFQLGPGGVLEDIVSDDVKALFVEQVKSGLCTAGTGSAVITHKDCSAVVQILREFHKLNIQAGSQVAPEPERPAIARIPEVRQALGQERDLIATIRARLNEPHVGSKNCGNTCYLNSSLQLLSYIPEVVESLLHTPNIQGKSRAEVQIILNNRSRLFNIFKSLYTSRERIDLSGSGNLNIFDGIFDNLRSQQDAIDFIENLIDTFYINDSIFSYTKTEQLVCDNGQIQGTEDKQVVTSSEKTVRLQLPTQPSSVQDLIVRFLGEQETRDNISDCIDPANPASGRGPATNQKTYVLNPSNTYLLVSLNRIDDQGNKSIIPITVDNTITFLEQDYTLYGAILHKGRTMNSGHYTFLKINQDLETGIFYNDDDVTVVNHVRTWKQNEFTLNGNAYVVAYKRADLPDEEIDADNREMARVPTFTVEQVRGLLENPDTITDYDLRTAIGSITRLITVANGKHNYTSPTRQELDRLRDALRDISDARARAREEREYTKMFPATQSAPTTAATPAPAAAAGQPPAAPAPQPAFLGRRRAPAAAQAPPAPAARETTNNRPSLSGFFGPNNFEAEPNAAPDVRETTNNQPSLSGFFGPNNFEAEPNAAPAARETTNNQPSLSGFFGPNNFEAEPNAATTASYGEEFYEVNPKNFQLGHLRMNFGETRNNRRVYANAIIGRERTRIRGSNVANIKAKYNSRKAKLNAAAANAKRAAEARAENARKAAEAARKEAEKAAGVVMASRLAAEKAAKEAKDAEAKRKANAAAAAEKLKVAQKAADLAAGKKSGLFSRIFKRGGNKTRRNTRKNRKSRRRN